MEPAEGAAMERAKRILLVEDEPLVRQLAAAILEKAGFSVRKAANGREALEILEGPTGDAIDLIITDMLMPEMGGGQLVRQAARRRPGLLVLFMSGYFEPGGTGQDSYPEGSFLAKPFRPDELLEKVHGLIGRSIESR